MNDSSGNIGALDRFCGGGTSARSSAARIMGVPASLASSASGLATVSLPIEKGASMEIEERLSASLEARGTSTVGGAEGVCDAGDAIGGGDRGEGSSEAGAGLAGSSAGGAGGEAPSVSFLASSAPICCHS